MNKQIDLEELIAVAPTYFADFVRDRDAGDTFKIFPCLPGSKEPATPNGFKDATADIEQLRKWAEEMPTANVAHCPEDNGLCVLDVDPPLGAATLKTFIDKHGPLPKTYKVRTPRGGDHYLFAGSLPSTVGTEKRGLGPKLDTRGRGGYALIAGRTEDGEYEIVSEVAPAALPSWIAEELKARKHERQSAAANIELDSSHDVQTVRSFLKKYVASGDVAISGSGGNDRTIKLFNEVLDHVSEDKTLELISEIWNPKCDPQWTDEELDTFLDNAIKYRQNQIGSSVCPPAAVTFAAFLATLPEVTEAKEIRTERLHFRCAANIKQEPVEWIWTGRLARGKITLLGGDPGLGKSTITNDITARITRGTQWPDGEKAPLGSCLILSAEDGDADTIVPRLDLAGADLSRVYILHAVRGADGRPGSFSLQTDLNSLAETVRRIGDVSLIIIDPITAYMGDGVDSHRTTDVRAVLEPLCRFADDLRVAVLAVTHPPKAGQAKALHAFTGSYAYVAAVRLAFFVVADKELDRNLLLPVKNNLGPLTVGFGYRIKGGTSSKGIGTSRIVWDSVPVTVTANQAMAADRGETRPEKARREAVEFLRKILADGPVSASDVETYAKSANVSVRNLILAADTLNVVKMKTGFKDGWAWQLPELEAKI